MTVPRIAIRAVSKSYAGVHALRDVSFDVAPGEVHALIGENGAGKSTLIKILSGATAADAGTIALDDAPLRLQSPRDALHAGIATVYQDAQIVPALSVAENIFLGHTAARRGFVDARAVRARARGVLEALGVHLAVDRPARELSTAQQQLLQIARGATYSEQRVLVLDEPTSALTPGEVRQLFALVARFKRRGASVLFISHRLEEVLEIADRVTVLRDGRHIATRAIADVDEAALVRLMVGREVVVPPAEVRQGHGGPRLAVRGLTGSRYRDVDLAVHAGEVLGVFGLVGAGRTELLRGIFGLEPPQAGTIEVGGRTLAGGSPRAAREAGLALVPEDRKAQGLVGGLSVLENIAMVVRPRFTRHGFVRRRALTALAERYRSRLSIRAASLDAPVESLSGGNQQKVVIAKWLAAEPDVLMLDEPTAGIDVGAKAEVYALIRSLAAEGRAVLVVSSEMPEILALSDRVLVMHEGRVTGIVERDALSEETLMALASGLAAAA